MAFWEKRQKEQIKKFKREYMYWIKYSENIYAKYKHMHVEKKYNCEEKDDYIKCSENIYARYKNRYKEGILGH